MLNSTNSANGEVSVKRGPGRPKGSLNHDKKPVINKTILRVLNQVIKSVPESSDAELACYFLMQYVQGDLLKALIKTIAAEQNEANAFLIELLREEFDVPENVEETITLESSTENNEQPQTTEETQAA